LPKRSKILAIIPKKTPDWSLKFLMEKPPTADDASLLAQIAQQEQSALSLLYDRYARIIYSLAFKSLRSVEESEEVVLDVFAQVWRIAQRYDPQKGRADTWLFTLARSRILDRLRKMGTSKVNTTISMDELAIQPKAPEIDLLETVSLQERRVRVLAALEKLPSEQRKVVELAYYQGLSQSQIAAQLNLSLGTVKTRIRLGLNKLKVALGDENDL
jgi:RNA polymerase sigma factor (sigma-70 family)